MSFDNNGNSSNNQSEHPSLMSQSSNPRKRPSIPPATSLSSLVPTDRESLFARLDSAIESAAEEEAGRIPKDLLIGPSAKVESAGKKRRTIPSMATASSHHTPTIAGTGPDTSSLPHLSSPSSSSSLSLDFSNSSHSFDKAPVKKSVRIVSPTRDSQGRLEYAPSSVQFDPSSSLVPDQEVMSYARTPSRRRQPPASPPSQIPLMELSVVTGNMAEKTTSAGPLSAPSSHARLSPPEPTSLPPSLFESVGQIEQGADVTLSPTTKSTPEALISAIPTTSALDKVGPISNIATAPLTTTTAPLSSSAIAIEDDDPPQQPVSIAEKHRTSFDEPAGSYRPTKKRNDGINKDSDQNLSNPNSPIRSSSSPPLAPPSPSKTKGRPKKEIPVVPTVASRIGSRRKQHVTESATTAAPVTRSASAIRRSPVKSTKSLQKSGSVIEIDDGDDNDEHSMNIFDPPTLTPLTTASSSSKPQALETPTTSSTSPSGSKSTSASKSTLDNPPASNLSAEKEAASPVRIYVIPTLMDKRVFSLSRDRVLQLKWEWLGPLEKTLSTDPRGKQDAPALNQEETTHIVTALSDMENVKKFFQVESIDRLTSATSILQPKIEIVSNQWLTDTIMYKRPMEPDSYRIARPKPQQIIPVKIPVVNTPPHVNISTLPAEPDTEKQPRYAKFESIEGNENGAQLDFNEIVLGIKEGSLEGGELSDDEQDHESESEEDYNEAGGEEAKEKGLEAGASASKMAPEVLEKLKSENKCFICQEQGHWKSKCPKLEKLRKENRCFHCQEQGHWANKCPKDLRGTKDDVLLQIISSGKSEGKRRSKILYRCQEPHPVGQKDEPTYNKAILEQLKTLMDHYENIKVKGSNEHFKVINYRKAITAIRALDYEITSEEMALKIPRVGKKLAQKIGECVALGKIKKLDHLNWDQERSKTETLFRSVYGAGSEKATEWYNRGLRTLDDLRALPDLTKNQISGLKFYDDLLVRVPRSEVEQIGKVVEAAAHKLHPEILSQVTGSYRRGKPDCGDIDIVVGRPNIDNGGELFLIMDHILNELIDQGFLVDHLSLPAYEESMATRPKHFKYMGICKLPGENQIHRHIDILVVPWIHHGAVMLAFTGNDICNRSMRLLASNRGMRLSDKGLFDNVLRGKGRKKLNEGRWVVGRTEREIFDYLKIKYLEPYEREC
ncbi:hypothetical protein BGX23_010393 [Mortierella sp. AD031]|nr:hypothetical protein BGX23_010393 [Mortierella sp. AD031]KAG0205635.1 hypothetical protein BGX33_007833 [Mortierella sp. NVP41]